MEDLFLPSSEKGLWLSRKLFAKVAGLFRIKDPQRREMKTEEKQASTGQKA